MMSRMIRYTMVSVFALALAGKGVAFAQEEGGEGGGEAGEGTTPTEGGEGATTPPEGGGETTPAAGGETAAGGEMGAKPPMILGKGKIAVAAAVGINLSKDLVAKPIAIAPDVWYGVMPKLEVGVAHSNMGTSGFWGQGLGGGICVTGKDSGCPKAYNGPINIGAHYLLAEGGVDLAADAGVLLRALDPMWLDLKAGVKGRWMSGKIAVFFDPNIWIGLTKRDEGNKEFLNVPVSLGFMATPKLHVGVQTGIYGPLSHFGDFYAIPVSLGAMFMVNNNLAAGASFDLFRVAGFEGPGAADIRGLTIFAEWHN